MEYDPKIHHRKSFRLKGYDYSLNGAYFITICVQDMKCVFGKIIDGKMVFNELGKIAEEYWKKIGELHDFVDLSAFVIMPNHVHGIIVINHDDGDVGASHRHAQDMVSHSSNAYSYNSNRVSPWETPTRIRTIQLPKKGIPSLMNHYKGAVKKWANKNHHEYFSWQRNYHEHIIRNEQSFEKIHDYIVHNPKSWHQDCFFIS